MNTGKGEKGIVFTGVAVSMPLILISLFIFLYLGQYLLSKSSLRHAVLIGTRFGATRGKETLAWRDGSTGILEKIKDYKSGGAMPLSLYSSGYGSVAETNYSQIMTAYGNYPTGTTLKDLQPEAILSLISAYESIKTRMSSDVKYPCSVSNSGGATELFDTPGCLVCYPWNSPSYVGGSLTSVYKPYIRNFISIGCVYNPSNLFIRPILSLFSLMGMETKGWSVVTAQTTSRISGGLMCPDEHSCLKGP